jgi:hypothetical protein
MNALSAYQNGMKAKMMMSTERFSTQIKTESFTISFERSSIESIVPPSRYKRDYLLAIAGTSVGSTVISR